MRCKCDRGVNGDEAHLGELCEADESEWWLTSVSSTQLMVHKHLIVIHLTMRRTLICDYNNFVHCAVEATAYISAVAAFAVVVLVVLLFLGRRWCYTAVFGRKCCDDILEVSAHIPDPGQPLDNAQFGESQFVIFPPLRTRIGDSK